jgi:hypothetical protein
MFHVEHHSDWEIGPRRLELFHVERWAKRLVAAFICMDRKCST